METCETLQQKSCKPCEGGTRPLTREEALAYLSGFSEWILDPDGKSIHKQFPMKNFMAAVDLINEIARLAESEGHHPDLHLTGYRNLGISLSTHAIGGLSENDFILASKIEKLPKAQREPKKQA